MYNFDSYNVLLTKYSCAAYDCAAGTQIWKVMDVYLRSNQYYVEEGWLQEGKKDFRKMQHRVMFTEIGSSSKICWL